VSLNVIYGKAHSGKTTECYKIIDSILNNSNDKIIYMVPEQYSLDAERKISDKFSKIGGDRIEVLGFERLATSTFSKVGPVVCDFLDDNAKIMLVERILIKLNGKFTYFSGSAKKEGFAAIILDMIKLLKKNCVSVEALKKASENSDNAMFKLKIYDIIMILEEYNSFFNLPYADTENNMDLLAEKIEKFGLFRDTHIILDNYMTFSAQQFKIIEKMLVNCPTVTVTLTTDSTEYKTDFEVFYRAKLTLDKLYSFAYDNNVKVEPNKYLSANYLENDELNHLINNYFNSNISKFENETKNLFVIESQNAITEIDKVACEITKLVRENNYRYKDIAVITRNSSEYYPIIADAFERYNIYYNITESITYDKNFLCKGMMSIFNIVSYNYSLESIMEFVHSDLCDMGLYDKFLLENYVLEVGNTSNLWSSDKEITFKGSFSDKSFERVKKSIYYVRDCIKSFTDNFEGRKTVNEIVGAYNKYLAYINAEESVKKCVYKFKGKKDIQMAKQTVLVYNHIIKSLNQMSIYFGDIQLTFEKFYKILSASVSNFKLDAVPSGVDDVEVTTIDRFQATKVKAVFVVGLNDGTIPRGYISDGILKDSELEQLGIEESILKAHCDENYVIYRMFNCATDKLYLSYPNYDSNGGELGVSTVIPAIKRIFGKITVLENIYEKEAPICDIGGIVPTFKKAISGDADGFWGQVILWYKKNMPQMYDKIISAKNYTNQPSRLFGDVIKKLYGDNVNSSISRIENYNKCAFSYFVRYGLGVEERKKFKIDAKSYGTFMHEIIENFCKYADKLGWENVTDEICIQKAKDITKQVMFDNLGEYYTDSPRQVYLFKKITKIMETVIKNVTEFYKESKYVNLGYELDFSEGSEFDAITVKLDDGSTVKLKGKVDRADILQTEGGDLVSIVDYKSGKKDIEFEKIICGIQIQLPIYLKAICDNLGKSGKTVFPSAMLYYNIYDPVIADGKSYTNEEIAEKIKAELRMKGLVEENSNIPDGFVVKRNKVVTLNQIDKLCNSAYKKVKSSLEEIMSGNISINPICTDGTCTCEYCPYFNICNFDLDLKGNQYSVYGKMTKEEFFNYVTEMDR